MTEVADQVRAEINQAIKSNKLVLPTLPEVALNVRDLAASPDATPGQMVQLVSSDPAMSARIIRVANSPLLRGNQPTEDLKAAVVRMGMNYTCNLVTGLAIEQMFQASSAEIDERLRSAWAESVEVAGICHALSRRCTKLQPDQATLAGLVHKIGALPVLTYVEDHPKLIATPDALDALVEELQGPVGCAILEAWNFSPALASVPVEFSKTDRTKDSADYADLVAAALVYCAAARGEAQAFDGITGTGAFARLNLDPACVSEDSMELHQEIAVSMNALH